MRGGEALLRLPREVRVAGAGESPRFFPSAGFLTKKSSAGKIEQEQSFVLRKSKQHATPPVAAFPKSLAQTAPATREDMPTHTRCAVGHRKW